MWRETLLFSLLLAVAPVAAAIEEPKFELLSREGDMEVRRYANTIVAEVVVGGDLETASNRGFRLVAGYIFGGNRAVSQVSAAPSPEKIAMTAPVVAVPEDRRSLEGANRWRVQFVMPSKYTMATLPEPIDPRVLLREVPAQQFAARTFSGFVTDARVASETEALRTWMSARGLQAAGPAQLARYNPPWSIPFLRRNEILIPLR